MNEPEPAQNAADRDAVTGRQHFAGLDGLRGVAAIIVVFAHSVIWLDLAPPPHFFLAVDFFFVLSGFVVAHAYGERLATRRLGVAKFIKMRLIRLHPLLILGIMVALAGRMAQWARGATELPLSSSFIAAVTGALSIPCGSAGDEAAFALNPPQWSLFAEYAVNLLFAWIAPRLSPARLAALIVLGALLIAGIAIEGGTLNRGSDLVDWPLSLARIIFPFFLGVAIARLNLLNKLPAVRLPWVALAAILGGVLLMPAVPHDALLQLFAVLFVFPLIILFGRYNEPHPGLASVMLWMGAISYPLYILHFPLVRIIGRLMLPQLDPSMRLLGVAAQLAAALIFAQLALKLFDEPIRRFLHPRRR